MSDFLPGVPFAEAVAFLRERLAIGEDEWQRLIREVDDAARARAITGRRCRWRGAASCI